MKRSSILGRIGLVWGVGGVLLLLGWAIWRLVPVALAPLREELDGFYWFAYAASAVFFAYTEGYRGFQTAFSPRVVARAFALAENPKPGHVFLAPAFCMSFFHAIRRRLIASWVLTLGIVGLVLLVRVVPQPWRGIIDLGVVVGLTWGMVTITVFWIRAGLGNPHPVPPDLP